MATSTDMYKVTVFIKKDVGGIGVIALGPFDNKDKAESTCTTIIAHLYTDSVKKPYRYKIGNKVSWIMPHQFSGVAYELVDFTKCGG